MHSQLGVFTFTGDGFSELNTKKGWDARELTALTPFESARKGSCCVCLTEENMESNHGCGALCRDMSSSLEVCGENHVCTYTDTACFALVVRDLVPVWSPTCHGAMCWRRGTRVLYVI